MQQCQVGNFESHKCSFSKKSRPVTRIARPGDFLSFMPKVPPPVYPIALPRPEGDRSTVQIHIDWTIHNMMLMGGPEQVFLCNPDDRCLEMRMKAVSINHGLC
jgi:hypothetical protein